MFLIHKGYQSSQAELIGMHRLPRHRGASSHMLANTTSIGESCAVCHSSGSTFAVDKMHASISDRGVFPWRARSSVRESGISRTEAATFMISTRAEILRSASGRAG